MNTYIYKFIVNLLYTFFKLRLLYINFVKEQKCTAKAGEAGQRSEELQVKQYQGNIHIML